MILLTIVRVWLSRHTVTSPSWMSLKRGPTAARFDGTVGQLPDRRGESGGEGVPKLPRLSDDEHTDEESSLPLLDVAILEKQ